MTADRQHSWSSVLGALLTDQQISREAASWAMGEIMSGSATDAQTAGFVVALRAAGESPEAVAGLVETMLEHAAPAQYEGRCVDIVGTGGDQAHTVNISTMASLTIAACGIPVAKHGNRAASSSCGSADVLEELGVRLQLDGPGVVRCIEEAGIGFFFAPQFHSGMRYAGPARRELGVPTVFNYLGPLSNPARPQAMAVGCADARMAPILADVMAMRDVSALVFRGDDGLDELTTTTTSSVWLVPQGAGSSVRVSIDPGSFGLQPATPDDLRGGLPADNAAVVRDYLAGTPGPVRDAVLLNAAAGIVAYDGVPGDVDGLQAALGNAIERAAVAVDAGLGAEILRTWIGVSNADQGED